MNWEYKTHSFGGPFYPNDNDDDKFNDYLNKLGDQGWELVQIVCDSMSGPTFRAIFKRPRS
jgi:hypothetical protein